MVTASTTTSASTAFTTSRNRGIPDTSDHGGVRVPAPVDPGRELRVEDPGFTHDHTVAGGR